MKYYETDEVKEYSGGKPLGVWIGNLGRYNEGALVGEWVRFPTSRDEIDAVMKRIGIGTTDVFGQPYEEWFIGDYDCYVKGMSKYLGEYESLDELNYLTARIERMHDDEFEKFVAAIEYGDNISNCKDLINLTYSLEEYDHLPDIRTDTDLGRYLLEDSEPVMVGNLGDVTQFLDYERVGKYMRECEGGMFTEYGYVSNWSGDFEEIYTGDLKDIPEKYLIFREPENYLKNAEMQMEDDYGMVDGIINNGPKESVKDRLKMAEEKCEKQPAKEHVNAKEEICI